MSELETTDNFRSFVNGDGTNDDGDYENVFFYADEHIYNLQDLLSELVSLRELFPLGGIALSELVLLG